MKNLILCINYHKNLFTYFLLSFIFYFAINTPLSAQFRNPKNNTVTSKKPKPQFPTKKTNRITQLKAKTRAVNINQIKSMGNRFNPKRVTDRATVSVQDIDFGPVRATLTPREPYKLGAYIQFYDFYETPTSTNKAVGDEYSSMAIVIPALKPEKSVLIKVTVKNKRNSFDIVGYIKEAYISQRLDLPQTKTLEFIYTNDTSTKTKAIVNISVMEEESSNSYGSFSLPGFDKKEIDRDIIWEISKVEIREISF